MARPLLHQDELAAGEIPIGRGQQHRHLQRENMLAVEVLVQAVEVPGPIAEQERRRPRLAGRVAALEELIVSGGKPDGQAERFLPAVGKLDQSRVERAAQRRHHRRERVGEIFVFALPEAVPGHDDAAAEGRVVRIALGQCLALGRGQQRADDGGTDLVELAEGGAPVQ